MGFCTTISAQRRRAEIQGQLSKNRKKTQELMATRRKALQNPWDQQDPRSDKCPDCEETALCSFHLVGVAHQPEDYEHDEHKQNNRQNRTR